MSVALQLLPKKENGLKEFKSIFPEVYKLILETSVEKDEGDDYDDYDDKFVPQRR